MTLECIMDMSDASAAASTNTLASSSISLDAMQPVEKNSSITETTTTNSTQETKSRRANATIVSPPKMFECSFIKLEYSIHVSPKRMTRELFTVFPGKDLANLLVVPTFQKCGHQMVAYDATIAKEKDDRLEDFVKWSTILHDRLDALGFWSDMTDPASGFPNYSERGRDIYPDVEGCHMLLKYDFQTAGRCKILLHPNWGSKVYPATFFTTAPLDVLQNIIEQVQQDFSPTE
ncbi:hypothetical protein CPB97_006444 [Podila verticillata]|nr:hypothetical protein CPB97_006444 [Podila verticillata]